MGTAFSILLGLLTIAAGVVCIASPAKAYNMGRKQEEEPPKNWPVISRVVGAVAIVASLLLFWFEFGGALFG